MAVVLHLDHIHPTPTDGDQICDSHLHEDYLRAGVVGDTLRARLVQLALDVLIGPIEPTQIPMDHPWDRQVGAQPCLLRRERPCIPVNHPIKHPIIPPVP